MLQALHVRPANLGRGADHAVHAAEELEKVMDKMRKGERQKILIGTGHGMCTCQGAAFEYIFNVEHEIRKAGLREVE